MQFASWAKTIWDETNFAKMTVFWTKMAKKLQK